MRPDTLACYNYGIVNVKDADTELAFKSLADFEAYFGGHISAFDGYDYICYMPGDGVLTARIDNVLQHIDFEQIHELDALIAMVPILAERKADKFYTLSLEEAIALKLKQLKQKDDYQDAQPFEYPAESGVFYKVTAAIERTILQNTILGLADTDPIPQHGGKWDNHDATVSTDFTVGELKELFSTGYAIPQYNYEVLLAHKANIMALTTVVAVRDYDITVNWK